MKYEKGKTETCFNEPECRFYTSNLKLGEEKSLKAKCGGIKAVCSAMIFRQYLTKALPFDP